MGFHDEIWRQVPHVREAPGWDARRAHCASLVKRGERVLDLGCGDGLMLAELSRMGADPVGADPSAVALERARERGDHELVLSPEGDPLPFPDADFDGVWASEVLTHALDTGGLLDEARRVLRPGGWIGVTVRRESRLRLAATTLTRFAAAHDPERTQIRRYTRSTLAAQLRRHRFDNVRVGTKGGGWPGSYPLLLASAVRSAGPASGGA